MIFASGDITEFMSIDLTTIIATLLNTLILFLILKHFLFDKVNKVIKDRQEEIRASYDRADEAEKNAQKLENRSPPRSSERLPKRLRCVPTR